eukprot:COSAG02_NODE_68125_length_251_cov_0.684211_1_plen_50_part_00
MDALLAAAERGRDHEIVLGALSPRLRAVVHGAMAARMGGGEAFPTRADV